MLEILTGIIVQYGLPGLFIACFLVSTIFIPFTLELFFPPLIAVGVNPVHILLVAVSGSMLGVWLNYLLGYYGVKLIHNRISKQDLDKAKRIMDRYGWFGLFLVMVLPLPLPTDPLTVLCGMSRMNPIEFTIASAVGKLIKYGISIGLFKLFF
jgi:membrane protein YqaA with SNARE-associated domain